MYKKKRLRVGVIGCGQIAQVAWFPYIHELDEFEVVSLCDVSQKLVNYFGDLYGVERRYTQWEDLIGSDNLDAVIVLTRSHTDICIAAAQAKKHILVEKPLCENSRQAREIEKAVRKNGILLMVGEMKRYDPGYRYAQKIIREMKGLRMIRVRDFCDGLRSSQGEIFEAKIGNDIPDQVKQEDERIFREGLREVTAPFPESYYFHLLMAGVHDIHIMRAAFGEPLGVKYCDIWDDGNLLMAELDYEESVKALVEVGYTEQKWFEEELIAYGLDKTVTVKFPHPYLKNCPTLVEIREIEDGAIVEKTIRSSFDEAFRIQLKHFYACVTENSEPLTNVEEGRKDIELLTQIFQTYARRVQNEQK